MDVTGTADGSQSENELENQLEIPADTQHEIPTPPPPPADDDTIAPEPSVANPFEYEPPPLRAGQLAPPWRSWFVAGWLGVIVGFGCVWQATRLAGLAPWWLGPETDPRPIVLIAVPFIAPIIAIITALVGWKWAVYVGLVASGITFAIASGDLAMFPGLALGQAAIGLAGLMITAGSFAGRMRLKPR